MSAAMNRRILVFRVMSLCVNLASGCTTLEPISMDAPQGATAPGYVSAAFRESEGPSGSSYFPVYVPAPMAEEGDEDPPAPTTTSGEAVAGFVVDTGFNVLKALFHPGAKQEQYRPATKVVVMKPAPVAPRPYVMREHKHTPVKQAQYSPPKPAQHKTIHVHANSSPSPQHRASVHKSSGPKPPSARK
jgi:hypothetical protein